MWAEIKKAINSNINKTLDVLIQERFTETNQKIDSKASQTSVNSLDTKVQNINTSLGTTNSKVDSRASQTSVNNLDTKVQEGNNLIGATNNTGGTATSGSLFAKINKLLTDWTTARAGYIDTTISSRQASWGATTAHRDRLDVNISSRASQTSVDSLDTKVNTLVNGRVVKSKQSVDVFLTMHMPTGLTYINITPVDMLKSVILSNPHVLTMNGDFGQGQAKITFSSNSQIVVNVTQNFFEVPIHLSLDVIEFY